MTGVGKQLNKASAVSLDIKKWRIQAALKDLTFQLNLLTKGVVTNDSMEHAIHWKKKLIDSMKYLTNNLQWNISLIPVNISLKLLNFNDFKWHFNDFTAIFMISKKYSLDSTKQSILFRCYFFLKTYQNGHFIIVHWFFIFLRDSRIMSDFAHAWEISLIVSGNALSLFYSVCSLS